MDSGDLKVSNTADGAVDNVVGENAIGYGADNNQVDNGQLLGMGGNVGNVMNDSNLNTVSGEEVTNAVESAQAIDAVSASDNSDALADGANVAEIEQPQSANLYGNAGQTQLDDSLQLDNNLNVAQAGSPMDMSGGDLASDAGMGAVDSGATMTASLPEMGAKMVYLVKKGDTLGRIAQSIYGDKSKWRDLAAWSGFANPHLIFPGDVVYYQYTQESASFAANYETQQRMEEVVVQAGDSLSKIAARVYGNPMAWIVLWRHNGQVANPDLIHIGMKIHYPAASFLVAAVPETTQQALDSAVDQAVDQAEGQVVSQAPDQVPAAG